MKKIAAPNTYNRNGYADLDKGFTSHTVVDLPTEFLTYLGSEQIGRKPSDERRAATSTSLGLPTSCTWPKIATPGPSGMAQ
jgi:hypothetical protein